MIDKQSDNERTDPVAENKRKRSKQYQIDFNVNYRPVSGHQAEAYHHAYGLLLEIIKRQSDSH